MKIYGTFYTSEINQSDSTVATDYAAALLLLNAYSGVAKGNTWHLCNRYQGEVWLNPPSNCNGNNCPTG